MKSFFQVHSKYISKITFLFIFLFLIIHVAEAKKLNAFLTYSTFYSPEKGPYIETYLSIKGNSVNFIKNENGKYQGSVQIILLFRSGEEIINYDKYELLSPEIDDTLDVVYFDCPWLQLPGNNFPISDLRYQTR